jgi:hypothetical protein
MSKFTAKFVQDICVKTVLCGQEHLSKEFDKNMKSEYNCYKLWGFDVFIDSDLKPWVIEARHRLYFFIYVLSSEDQTDKSETSTRFLQEKSRFSNTEFWLNLREPSLI